MVCCSCCCAPTPIVHNINCDSSLADLFNAFDSNGKKPVDPDSYYQYNVLVSGNSDVNWKSISASPPSLTFQSLTFTDIIVTDTILEAFRSIAWDNGSMINIQKGVQLDISPQLLLKFAAGSINLVERIRNSHEFCCKLARIKTERDIRVSNSYNAMSLLHPTGCLVKLQLQEKVSVKFNRRDIQRIYRALSYATSVERVEYITLRGIGTPFEYCFDQVDTREVTSTSLIFDSSDEIKEMFRMHETIENGIRFAIVFQSSVQDIPLFLRLLKENVGFQLHLAYHQQYTLTDDHIKRCVDSYSN